MNLRWILLPLLLLLDLTVFTPALSFSKRHIDNPKSLVPGGNRRYCDVMMRRLWMIHKGKCKQINTFIHENLAIIVDFCKTPPVSCMNIPSMHNCHDSTHDVRVTDCFATPGTRPPHCHYRKMDSTRPIRVGCEQGVPVHLDG
ncbi:Hypothetical predicted protein [Marmota monax]|uniref:Ribonuclease A-domain domain-containing protein n=1 Tax=Marmota monax TaxID=9995 RepID=A0A5E4BSY6_MARMO|nr:ribonuclease 4-like [Urocitellus parryii]KAG3260792.1 ribonuclease 4-like [Ictidomys tridecemlineatus]VTJ72111.1 Hypothetical predicted protein [Marmota monax]